MTIAYFAFGTLKKTIPRKTAGKHDSYEHLFLFLEYWKKRNIFDRSSTPGSCCFKGRFISRANGELRDKDTSIRICMQGGLDYGSIEIDLTKGILPDSYFWEFNPSRAQFVFDETSGALVMSRSNEYAAILPRLGLPAETRATSTLP